jgi:hypothetical protein
LQDPSPTLQHEVAEPVDAGLLAGQHKRRGVGLFEHGRSLDHRADRQVKPGEDGGVSPAAEPDGPRSCPRLRQRCRGIGRQSRKVDGPAAADGSCTQVDDADSKAFRTSASVTCVVPLASVTGSGTATVWVWPT